jgi:hypothetical protein
MTNNWNITEHIGNVFKEGELNEKEESFAR